MKLRLDHTQRLNLHALGRAAGRRGLYSRDLGCTGQIAFDSAEEDVIGMKRQVVNGGFEQHAAGVTRRVVDGLAFSRIENVDHQSHD